LFIGFELPATFALIVFLSGAAFGFPHFSFFASSRSSPTSLRGVSTVALAMRNRVQPLGVSNIKDGGFAMDHERVPVMIFAALFAVIGVIAASTVLMTERSDGFQQTTSRHH
jgi:hypothetical protein